MKRMPKAMNKGLAIRSIIKILIACIAVLSISSCENPTSDDSKVSTKEPAHLGNDFQTFYLNISEAELAGLEGFHLKNKSANVQGIVIDRIFANSSKSTAGAVDVFNFDDPESGTKYWGFDAGIIADGVWSSGEVLAPSGEETEVYITGFATSEFAEAVYVGIVAKKLSSTVSGDDITFVPIIGDPKPELEKKFSEFFTN